MNISEVKVFENKVTDVHASLLKKSNKYVNIFSIHKKCVKIKI